MQLGYETFKEVNENLNQVVLNTAAILEGYEKLDAKNIEEFLQKLKEECLEIAGNPLTEQQTQEMLGRISAALENALRDIEEKDSTEEIKAQVQGQLEDFKTTLQETLDTKKAEFEGLKEEVLTSLQEAKADIPFSPKRSLCKKEIESAERHAMWIEHKKDGSIEGVYALGDRTHIGGNGDNGRGSFGDAYGGIACKVGIPSSIKIEEVYAFGYNCFAITNNRSILYVWGHNGDSYSLLGVGSPGRRNTPTRLTVAGEVQKVVCYDAYANHDTSSTFLILKNGNVLGCGRNNYGHLGTGNTVSTSSFVSTRYQDIIDLTLFKSHIDNTSSGYYNLMYSVLGINKRGELVCCGRNLHGELGLGHNNQVNSPYVKSFDKKVVKARGWCGTSAIIFEDGSVRLCGHNGWYHLTTGNATSTNVWTPLLKEDGSPLGNVKDILFSFACSFAITNDGELWAWGLGTYGYGGDEERANRRAHRVLSDVESIKHMQGSYYGDSHNTFVAKKKDGTLWGFGQHPKFLGLSRSAFKKFVRLDIGVVEDYYVNREGLVILKDNAIYVGNPIVSSYNFQNITK